MFHEAIDFLFLTRRRGIVPDVLTCNFLFNRLVEHGEVDKALAVYEQLKRFGFSPDCYTYAIVIKALCKKGDLKQPLCVFEEMERVGGIPHSYCYAGYIEGLCNNHRSDLGYEVLQAFRNGNAPLQVYTYEVVRGFSNEMKKLDEARGVFNGYCKSHNLLKALALHDEMVSRGVKANWVVVSYILRCLGRWG
ncbi:hypothetical protein GLYMA_18G262450v4 [Glycine max]|nr:hypothetical protein GLYMA_18G262450v4 [Glycine max]